ncbi:hypothetical protein BLS_001262 [Venturia inaequalis]|uniref:Uncharacterized protein n=1 Tax=Venturia inaequalis TaxID=5025 RepID=A0A8H3YKP3_VENIN|nr:hypothetical protein BLS_001262 [Venturia inaequalis]
MTTVHLAAALGGGGGGSGDPPERPPTRLGIPTDKPDVSLPLNHKLCKRYNKVRHLGSFFYKTTGKPVASYLGCRRGNDQDMAVAASNWEIWNRKLEREQDTIGSPTSHRAIPDSSQTVQPLTGSQLPLTPSTSQSHGGARTGAGRLARAVPKKAIRDWLYWLKENHPGYSDIGINDGIINSLPIDSSIADRIPVLDVEPEALIAPEAPDVVVPDVIVPDVVAPNTSAEDDDNDLYGLTAGIVERDARRQAGSTLGLGGNATANNPFDILSSGFDSMGMEELDHLEEATIAAVAAGEANVVPSLDYR